jgi:hypothetical protein
MWDGGTEREAEVTTMTHLVEKDTLIRANTALLLTLVWGALALCAFGAVVYDVGRWFQAW